MFSPSRGRKSMPSRPARPEVQNGELPRRRGSVYQSSQEVRKLKIFQESRRSIEPSNPNHGFLSFDIVGSSSLCRKNEDQYAERRTSSQTAKRDGSMPDPAQIGPRNSSEFLDLSFRVLLEEQPKDNPCVTRRDTMLDDLLGITLLSEDNCSLTADRLPGNVSPKLKGDVVFGNDASDRLKIGKMRTFPKSFSTKVSGAGSHSGEDSAVFRTTSKTRFGPLMRILDPLAKSMSLRSSPPVEAENGCLQTTDPENFNFFSSEPSFHSDGLSVSSGTEKIDCKEPLLESVEEAAILSSPVHLNGTLKMETRQKASSFTFSLNGLDDVLYSKTWRTGTPVDWVYTFHNNKRKSFLSSRSIRENQKQASLMIGQMQVSCYLCSEVGSTGSVDRYTVLEFVVYDISQARRSSVSEVRSCAVDTHFPAGSVAGWTPDIDAKEADNTLNSKKAEHQRSQTLGDCDNDATDSHPLALADLLPNLEIAAIVIQIPFDDKERLKDANTSDILSRRCSDIQKGFSVHQGKGTIPNNFHPGNMKVITPNGKHGLPCTEGCPSSLLYKWRSGGRCDCGGWDMGCPITVLTAKSTDHGAEFSLKKSKQSLRLDVQGSKDVMPALLIKLSAEGEYSVNFHAQFSALQAFSISIAVLHLLEYSRPDYGENMPILHSKSLKFLLEEEVRQLLDAVAEDEKRKVKRKVVRPTPSYCLLDPPFSPISRV